MVLRQELGTRDINGFKSSLHIDTGGPVGGDYFIVIRPSSSEDWRIVRWFYFDEGNEQYAWDFAEKVCTSEQYRQASLEKTADWYRIMNLYETFSRQLYNFLSNYRKSDFPIMNSDSREDRDKLYECCESLFEEIKVVVQENKNKTPEKIFKQHKQQLESYLDEKYQINW